MLAVAADLCSAGHEMGVDGPLRRDQLSWGEIAGFAGRAVQTDAAEGIETCWLWRLTYAQRGMRWA